MCPCLSFLPLPAYSPSHGPCPRVDPLVCKLRCPSISNAIVTDYCSSAMQMTVATSANVVIFDKFEQNPLHDAQDKPVWGSVYSTVTDMARPLHLDTNSFCATGTWLSNGTRKSCWLLLHIALTGPVINIGGNPLVATGNASASNGLQGACCLSYFLSGYFLFCTTRYADSIFNLDLGIRLFNPCIDGGSCDVYEDPTVRRTSCSSTNIDVFASGFGLPHRGGIRPLLAFPTVHRLFMVARSAVAGQTLRRSTTPHTSFTRPRTFMGIMACKYPLSF